MERQPDPRSRIGAGDPGGRRGGRQQIAGLYDLEETIGEGHYAVVKLARHVFTGEKVAVKVIDKGRLDAATRTQMLQEVQLMKLVQHPHVVRLYEVIDTSSKLYLVLEFADGGDMYDYIMRHEGGLEEEQARKYFVQIVAAIQVRLGERIPSWGSSLKLTPYVSSSGWGFFPGKIETNRWGLSGEVMRVGTSCSRFLLRTLRLRKSLSLSQI